MLCLYPRQHGCVLLRVGMRSWPEAPPAAAECPAPFRDVSTAPWTPGRGRLSLSQPAACHCPGPGGVSYWFPEYVCTTGVDPSCPGLLGPWRFAEQHLFSCGGCRRTPGCTAGGLPVAVVLAPGFWRWLGGLQAYCTAAAVLLALCYGLWCGVWRVQGPTSGSAATIPAA